MESNSIKHLKVLICQTKPVFKKKSENIDRIRVSLMKYNKEDNIDLVMFPEMAFTGYNFKDKDHIMEETQQCGQGITFDFCIDLAKKLNCHVLFGYAEKVNKNGCVKLYNSGCIIGRNGNILLNFHKTHLYDSDELWAEEGEGFQFIELKNVKGESFRCALAICMDINPYKWKSGKNEFADFCVQTKAEVILFISAWNDHEPDHPDENKSQVSIIQYWLHRLWPVLSTKKETKPKMLFLCCDRTGTETTYFKGKEQTTHFIGTSCAIRINPNEAIMKLGKKNEGYLMVDTHLPN